MSKKALAIGMAVILVVGTGITLFFVLRPSREDTLIIHNWHDFLAPGLREEFQQHYYRQTGRRIRVQERLFDSNETLRTRLVTANAPADIIIPSDYMLEDLWNRNLLKPLDLNRLPSLTRVVGEGENAKREINPTVLDPFVTNALTKITDNVVYGIPYFYGTMGILYDTRTPGLAEMIYEHGWASLWNHNATLTPGLTAAQRAFVPSIKEIGRESYTAAQFVLNRQDLLDLSNNGTDFGLEYRELIDSLFDETTQARISAAGQLLQGINPDVVFEIDQGKTDMITGDGDQHFGMEWSVSAIYAMMENQYLQYHVPREGTNLWVDAIAIPRRAVNLSAAYAFIEWILSPDVARRNMEWVGGSTPVIATAEAYFTYLNTKSDMFDGRPAQKANFLETLFPSRQEFNVLPRTGIMRYLGDLEGSLEDMFLQFRMSFI